MGMGIDWLSIFETNMYFFILSYTILGAGIKYIDASFDEKVFSKKKALVFAPLLGILWAYTMLINEISTTILLAVILAVLIKGKIDNYAHLFGLITITVFSILIIFFIDGNEFMILPLMLLTSAGLIDEVGNDVIEYNKKFLKIGRFRYRFTLYFFGRRYLLKVAILYVVLLGIFPWYFLIAFILFDEAYIIMDIFSQSRQNVDSS
jgi:hypothetical protein